MTTELGMKMLAQTFPTYLDADLARTVNRMRIEIDDMARGRWRSGDFDLGVGTLARQVFTHADVIGASGEDRYVMLAYHALESLKRMQEQLRMELTLNPRQAPIPVEKYDRYGG